MFNGTPFIIFVEPAFMNSGGGGGVTPSGRSEKIIMARPALVESWFALSTFLSSFLNFL